VTTYTYEPRFQQLKSMVGPRGHDPGHGPPSRYRTSLFYDYEEGSDFEGQDLNGDGKTDQASGNLVKIQVSGHDGREFRGILREREPFPGTLRSR